MSMLDGILNNPIIKTTLLGKLKTFFESDGVSLIAIKLDESGDLAFDVYKTPVTVMENAQLENLVDRLSECELQTRFETDKLGENE